MNDKVKRKVAGVINRARVHPSKFTDAYYADKIHAIYMESTVDGWVIEKCEYFGKVCPTSCKEISEIAEGVKACFADEPTRPATQQEVNDGKAVRK